MNEEIEKNNEMYEKDKQEQKKNKQKIKMTLDLIELENIDDTLNAKTITEEEYENLIEKQKLGELLSKDIKNSMVKYKLYAIYLINENADKNIVKEYIHDADKFNKIELCKKIKKY